MFKVKKNNESLIVLSVFILIYIKSAIIFSFPCNKTESGTFL